jgi:pseudaminic acid cytidylyltransferase
MNIAVIPARGGSKRIPRKNIRAFAGRPMIAWAIEAARASNLFAHIVVSTDDEEIAAIARSHGAETPFMRPRDLADDHTATVPVISHAVEYCMKLGWQIEYVCCIYPGSPLLQASDLVAALRLASDSNAQFVYPVTEYAHPVQRAMRRLPNGSMQFLHPEFELVRTQDLEKTYHDAGQFYWGRSSAWLAGKKMHTDGLGMPIPNWRVIDIDSEDDWLRAELLFKAATSRA